MTYTLKNENLTVIINSLGAEVVSVKDRNGRELWWNGDPAFWKGHSPILFPACGGLWNGKYSLNGKEYNMPKHGFAKGMEEGEKKGRMKEKLALAKNLAAMNMSLDAIAQATGLTKEEIMQTL